MATNQQCGSWDTYTKGLWWVGADGCWDGSACAIWHMTDGTWWFGDSDGWYAHNGWLMINRKWYYFDSDGWMLSNRWIGSWYVGEDGALEEQISAKNAIDIFGGELYNFTKQIVGG